MPLIKIEHVKLESESATRLMTELNDLTDRIRRRAFELFESRRGEHGSDLADWLQAESEIQFAGSVEVSREAAVQRFRLSVPGFDKKDLQVHVLDNDVIVTGQSEQPDSASSKAVRKILYRLPLPEGARTDEIVVDGKGSTIEIAVPTSQETASDQIGKSVEAARVQKQGAA
jgi:HSP20 family molecular chaperone IbpA